MKEYLLSIVGTVLLSAFLTAILPDGKTSGLIKAITRLTCTLAIVAPLLQFFQSGSSSFMEIEKSESIFSQTVIEGEKSFIHYYSELRVREAERALENEIAKNHEIAAEVSLQWKYESEVICIEKIFVKTSEKQDEEVLKGVWEYLTKNYCSEVLIE